MKTILITGASRGLGHELAKVFSKRNYNIILTAKDAGRLNLVADFLRNTENNVCTVPGDIRDPDTIGRLYAVAEAQSLDILINNAGALTAGTFREMDISVIREMIAVNLMAPIELTKAIYPIFLRKSAGLIININSIAGKSPDEKAAVYCASKYGLRGFFDSFGWEAAKHNIFAINIYLGATNTDMAKDRPDQKKLICPAEAARKIYRVSEEHESLRVSEIDLWRRNY